MTKKELIDTISKHSGLTKKDIDTVLNSLAEVIADSLKNGDKVTLSGLGTFEVKERKARTGINPFTQERIEIPASKSPSFKVSSALKKIIKEQ